MKQFNNIALNSKGFTLIEMIAAVGIFAITVGTISGLFVSAVRAQRKSLATQELLDRTSYIIEYMGRAIRMAQKELNAPACLFSNGLNYEITGTGEGGLRFINYQGICQEFFLKGGQLRERKNGDELPLTSDSLQIVYFNINLFGQSQTDNLQPRVTIFLEIESKRIVQSPPKIQIQTSVSQRALDVEY